MKVWRWSTCRGILVLVRAITFVINAFALTIASVAHGQQPIWHLPYASGSRYECTQGPHGTTSHHFTETQYDVDLALPHYTPVLAAADGTAYTFTGTEFGNSISIDHGGGLFTVYGHLEDFQVQNGQYVHRGDQIGRSGNTGISVGSGGGYHLHFGVHSGSAAGDPSSTTSEPMGYLFAKDRTAGSSTFQFLSPNDSHDFFCGDPNNPNGDGTFGAGHTYESNNQTYHTQNSTGTWHPDGSLLLDDHQGVWLVQGGKRKLIPNTQVFNTYGFDWSKIVHATPAELGCFTVDSVNLASPQGLDKGTPSGTIYLITDRGTKSGFASFTAFQGLGFNRSDKSPTIVSDGSLASVPDDSFVPIFNSPFPDGTLIDDSGTIYVITDSKRQGIATTTAAAALGYNISDAAGVSSSTLSTYSSIPVVTPPIDDASVSQCASGGGVPTITGSLTISPSTGPYYVGDNLAAIFTIKNEGSSSVTFDVLTAGGRVDGQCPTSIGCPDFTHVNSLTLGAGQSYDYSGTLTLPQAVNYNFFTAYEIGTTWNTSIPAASGVTTSVNNINVQQSAAVSITVATNPSRLQIIVDGGTSTAPTTFNWTPGSSHTIGVSSPQGGGSGVQYVFASWSNSGAQTQTIAVPSSSTTYTASFTTQYQLTTAVSPSGAGSVSPDCSSGCWYNNGANVSLQAAPNSGYVFSTWTGTTSSTTNPLPITMSSPVSETAAFNQQATVVTVATSPSSLHITVDGTTYTAPQSFNWTPGSSHTIGVSSLQSGGSGVQYAFGSWSNGGAQSQTINVPSSSTTYTASFTTQYQLTTAVSPSGAGSVSPDCSSGCWYNNGANVSLQATPNGGNTFVNWTGSTNSSSNPVPVIVNGPQNLTANFTTAQPTYNISGQITFNGSGLNAVTVTLSGNANLTATTSGNGNYTFNNLTSGNYALTPSLSGYTFSPSTQSVNNLSGNQSGVDFTATQIAPPPSSISGQVTLSGSGLSGVTLLLSGSSTLSTTTDSSGNYSFLTLVSGGNYAVTPTLSGYTFNPNSVSFNNLIGNQTANFTASGQSVVNLSSSSLSFGSQLVGTPRAAQSVTVTNTGTAALNFSSFAATGDFAVDASGTTCSASSPLAVNNSCAIALTFRPAATGSRTGLLTLTDDAGTQQVALSGTGTAPGVSLTPSSLAYGSEAVRTVGTALTATLTNTGTGDLSLTGILVSGDFTQTNTCGTLPATIAPNASCVISVTFAPTATGQRTGSVTVTDDASGGQQTVTLSGTGTAPGVTLTPSTVSFPGQPVGTTSSAQSIVVANAGTSNLNITAIAASGDFSQTNTCGTLPAIVAPSANCTLNVTFAPTASGVRTGTIAITDDAASSPQTVSLTGVGAVSPPTIAPASLSFAAQGIGVASSSQTVTLTNTSTVSLAVSAASITGASAGDFATSADTCSGAAVIPSGTCSIGVAFTPSATGSRTASLSFTDNATDSPQTVALTGTGTLAPLTITANDAARAYGAANPTFTAAYSGFLHGDTSSTLSGTLGCTTAATIASGVGTYPITCSGLSSNNYNITYVAGTLTVTTAALTITANNATRTYSAANPVFAATSSGFVNGDMASSLSGTLSCATNATAASATGAYPITCSGQSSTNYSISYVAGVLTVNKATALFGGLIGSQSVQFGAAAQVMLGGKIAVGSVIPPTNENVSVMIAGVSQIAAIGPDGSFTTTFNIATLAAASTPYVISYNYAGDANFTSVSDSSTNLTITAGFSVTPASGSSTVQSVSAGQPANYVLSFTPSGTSGTVTLGCMGAPIGATCTVTPGSLVLNGTNSPTATVTVTTTAHVQTAPLLKEQKWFGGWPGELSLRWPIGIIMLALMLAYLVETRRSRPWVALGSVILLVSIWVACGGGYTPPASSSPVPSANLSTTSLTFSSQNQGTTSAAQTVTVANNGNAALSVSSIAMSGTSGSDFAQTNNCGSSVNAGSSCQVSVTFSPTTTGSRAGAVTIADNAATSPQAVNLIGTGVPPVTPAGSYTLTVTSALPTGSGTVTHTILLTLTVN